MSYWWLCLLGSILAGLATSKGTTRLYFAAQLIGTLARWMAVHSSYYFLVYFVTTLLWTEMSIFLLWDAGVSKLTWRDAWLAGIWMTIVGSFGLTWLSLTEWYLLGEGLLFATLGMAMLLLAQKSKALLAIGTLTWGMAAYDFMYLLRPEVRETNSWAPSLMCSAAFLWLAAKQMRASSVVKA